MVAPLGQVPPLALALAQGERQTICDTAEKRQAALAICRVRRPSSPNVPLVPRPAIPRLPVVLMVAFRHRRQREHEGERTGSREGKARYSGDVHSRLCPGPWASDCSPFPPPNPSASRETTKPPLHYCGRDCKSIFPTLRGGGFQRWPAMASRQMCEYVCLCAHVRLGLPPRTERVSKVHQAECSIRPKTRRTIRQQPPPRPGFSSPTRLVDRVQDTGYHSAGRQTRLPHSTCTTRASFAAPWVCGMPQFRHEEAAEN
ncbi:hypothetical protein LX36DRAFT_329888 [Colletotrichum falcatum]|nr:hypothetical protein LX36DRAFT_329888 [Colletotrichum falcatum]